MNVARLIRVARHLDKADLVLKNGRILNVFTGQLETADIAITDGHIAAIGGYVGIRNIELDKAVVLPGFIDAHIHIESSNLRPDEFCRTVVKRGTTAVIADPHEIVNVAGAAGMRYMLDVTEGLPVKFYFMLPSCVPATDMETSGARFGVTELKEFRNHPRILGLAEVMDEQAVLDADPEILEKISLFDKMYIDGHAPGLSGADLQAYVAAGISTDHELSDPDEASEKISMGMSVAIRDGSTTKDLDRLAELLIVQKYFSGMLVSDDRDPEDLFFNGHMDATLRKAVCLGVDPDVAVRAVTINPARHYGLTRVGSIAPGYVADIAVVKDLREFKPLLTISRGIVAFDAEEAGNSLWQSQAKVPAELLETIKLSGVTARVFEIPASSRSCRVIVYQRETLSTGMAVIDVGIENGKIEAEPDRGLCKIAVVERYSGQGRTAVALLRGFGLLRGALASSVAHDAHNIIIAGVNDSDMVMAVNRIVAMQGGQVAVAGGEVLADCPLPIGGLMSLDDIEGVAEQKRSLHKAAEALGAFEKNPFMALSFLSLSAIPRLKITDHGLIDVENHHVVPLCL